MTLYQIFRGAALVFRIVQDARHHVVADELPGRPAGARRNLECDPAGAVRTQAPDRRDRAAARLRIFAARKSTDVHAGESLSGLGSVGWYTGWHYRAGRADRCRSVDRARDARRPRLSRPD